MLLTLDQGNSCLKIGAFLGDKLQGTRRLDLDAMRPAPDSACLLESCARELGVEPGSVTRVVLSSVVPAKTNHLIAACSQAFAGTPLVVDCTLNTGLDIAYEHPETLGADRLANAVATRARCSGFAICVDLGTAINLDVVSDKGAYLGGVIAPGMQLSVDALCRGAARLPRVPLRVPSSVVATNTLAALQSGALFGFAGLIAGLIEGIEEELGVRCTVVATGGQAALIHPILPRIDQLVPELTLEGLQLLNQLNPV